MSVKRRANVTSIAAPWRVVDLFSGAGGMSFGFHAHPRFRVVAAADAEIGKPSGGQGLQCNASYFANMGIVPANVDLGGVDPRTLGKALGLGEEPAVDVLLACPPCTGFSRTNPMNHLRDDHRNDLVRRSAEFAVQLNAKVLVMENARELIDGNFGHHYDWMRKYLEGNGYSVRGEVHMLSKFGLPQIRERAMVVAARDGYGLHSLAELWDGHSVLPEATTVRRAFDGLKDDDPLAVAWPSFSSAAVRERIAAIPKDGGSWLDIANATGLDHLLTGSMKRILSSGRIGSYPDVYGRMWWDRPAPTIKRECSHVGNGRYAHPVEDRLCSVREMAVLQGFPRSYRFGGTSLSNMYRHIGDAVPPLISHQLAHVCSWILSSTKPPLSRCVLGDTHLKKTDILPREERIAQNG